MATAVDNTALFHALIKIFEKNEQNGQSNRNWEKTTHEGEAKLRLLHLSEHAKTSQSKQQCRLYSLHARQILSDITELRDLVLDKRKEYILCSNAFSMYGTQRFMTEGDRKKFDRETDVAIKQCTKLIKDLEMQIQTERTKRSLDESTHLMTIVNLLNVYLKDVLSTVEQLRQIHIQKTRQYRKICRLSNLVELYGTRLDNAEKEERIQQEKLARMKLELEENRQRLTRSLEKNLFDDDKENTTEPTLLKKDEILEDDIDVSKDGWDDAGEIPELLEKPEMIENVDSNVLYENNYAEGWTDAELDISIDSFPPETTKSKNETTIRKKQPKRLPLPVYEADESIKISSVYEPINKAEQTQLTAENRKLYERFTTTDDELQRIESHVTEIQRLQNVFAEKISEQEQDIDIIHSRTVYILDNLEQANDFIREAIKNQANRRVIMIFCLLVLTFTLLFLDWYNP